MHLVDWPVPPGKERHRPAPTTILQTPSQTSQPSLSTMIFCVAGFMLLPPGLDIQAEFRKEAHVVKSSKWRDAGDKWTESRRVEVQKRQKKESWEWPLPGVEPGPLPFSLTAGLTWLKLRLIVRVHTATPQDQFSAWGGDGRYAGKGPL